MERITSFNPGTRLFLDINAVRGTAHHVVLEINVGNQMEMYGHVERRDSEDVGKRIQERSLEANQRVGSWM